VDFSENTAWPLTAIIITSDSKKAVALVDEIEDSLEDRSTDCAIVTLQGKETEEIINYIKEGAVELMVMGAFGHNRLRSLIMGSTTSYVIQKSTIPVLLTR
jgi:nucleotide-binding universal stress UspA family protein